MQDIYGPITMVILAVGLQKLDLSPIYMALNLQQRCRQNTVSDARGMPPQGLVQVLQQLEQEEQQ